MSSYQIVFGATYGLGPWVCHFCKLSISPEEKGRDRLEIHHLDGDHSNDVVENLVPTHRSCHARHHNSLRVGESHPLFGKPRSEDTCQKIREALAGRTLPEGTRKKMSASRLGEKNPFYGRTHEPEAVEKVRQANLGRKQSAETIAKRVVSLRGRPGRPWTEEERKAQSERLLNRSLTVEHRLAIAAGLRASGPREPRPLVTCERCGGSYVGNAGLALHRKGSKCLPE